MDFESESTMEGNDREELRQAKAFLICNTFLDVMLRSGKVYWENTLLTERGKKTASETKI